MNYEQKYNEALKRAKKFYNELAACRTKQKVAAIFPELAESEDERIRQWIVVELQESLHEIQLMYSGDYDGRDDEDRLREEYLKKAIAYLEKQKEQKVDIDKLRKDIYQSGYNDGYQHGEEDAQKEQKPNIELIKRSWYMEGYTDGEFMREPRWNLVTGEGGLRYKKNEKYGHPLEQKPADEAEKFFDSAESYNQGFVAGQKKMKEDIEKGFGIGEHSLDYLAGRYAGYEAAKQEQKPAEWSEEDEEMIDYAYGLCYNAHETAHSAQDANKATKCMSWLKSLRTHSKIEWTEEDDEKRNRAISYLSDWIQDHRIDKEGVKDVEAIKSWLSKLAGRPCDSCWRPSWKPSEEQMLVLRQIVAYNEDTINEIGNGYAAVLESLYEQLKAL